MARVPEIIRRNPISQVAAKPAASGQGWAALADLSKIGEDFVRPKALEQAREAGEKSVYRDDTGALQVDERSVLGGEMADAHNSAAYAKYLSQKQIDVSENFTELARQYEFDPAGFQAASDAYLRIQEEDESIPSVLREPLLASIRQESSNRFNGLQNSEIDRNYTEANRNTNAHRNMLVDDYISLFVGGNLEAAEAKMNEIAALTNFRTSAPYITESEIEGDAFLRGVRGAALAAGLTRDLQELQGESSITDEYRAELIETLNDPSIDPATRAKLYAATQSTLKGVDAAAIVAGLTDTSFTATFNRASGNGDFTAGVGGYSGGSTSQNQFIQQMMPAAVEAANRTGVDPRIIIAQAIQETGWGEHAPNNNYFGIKSHGQGGGSNLTTTEVINGETVTIQDNFRGYAGMAESVAGYADFLLDNPRYQAMMQAEGLDAQIAALGASGYATDPNYAASIASIAGKISMDGAPVEPQETSETRANNAAQFEAIGIEVTPTSEYLGLTYGLENAGLMLISSPDTMVSNLLPEEVISEHPELAAASVGDIMNQANRLMTTKASDLAAQQVAIDRIPDQEVRAMAASALSDQVNVQTRLENQALAGYNDRIEAGDGTLTTQEIMQDHSLSDQAQRSLAAKLNKRNEAQIEIQDTVMDINDPNFSWNAYDTSHRNRVDDAYVAAIDGADPLADPNAQVAAFQIAERTGFVPKTMFQTLRGAVNSNDPDRFVAAMEFAAQTLEVQPNAFANYGGQSEINNALSDYRFYAEFGSPEEAAQRVIEINQADPPKNVRDAASDAAANLTIGQIVDHYDDSMWSDPNAGSVVEQAEMMASYTRLFKEHYIQTGDDGISRNRALDQIGRIYGPNAVSGSQRIMKFPPQNFYPDVNGNQDWMAAQLEREISVLVFGDDVFDAAEAFTGARGMINAVPFGSLATGDTAINQNWINASSIKLVSDDVTRSEVVSGRPPSYQVFYTDADGMTQAIDQRYQFDPSLVASDNTASTFQAGKAEHNEAEAVFQERIDQMGSFMDGLPQGGN